MICINCGEEAEFEFRTKFYADGSEEEYAVCEKCGARMTEEEWDAETARFNRTQLD
jgi:protein-arginine kinase activator protein McsA